MFSVCQLSYVQCCCLVQYLRLFRRQCMYFVSRSTDFKTCQAKNLLQLYRQLQLLVCYYNKIQKDAVIVVLLVFAGYALVLSLFAIIQNGFSLTLLQAILFGSTAVDCLLGIVVMCGSFARLHTESTDTVKYLQTEFLYRFTGAQRLGSKQIKRLLISLTQLQVNFGSVNYIDRMTPMTIFDFCMVQLTNLLLCT